jgi:hypothetical protein
MNIFLPKFLVQTLRKRAKRKLGSRECRRGRITAQGCGGAGEEERAAPSLSSIDWPWNAVIASRENAKGRL